MIVVLGGAEDRHARRAGGEAAEQYRKNPKGAARVLDCLKDFTTETRRYPELVWHNSTSTELPCRYFPRGNAAM
ncbi:MAG: hypothetical protein M1835_004020 [Candelina submexicana]|nr:MAG: hypothetical protein M1835_004020 [Candelina submexicana]